MKAILDSTNGKVLLFCPGPVPVLKQGQALHTLTDADVAVLKANKGAKFAVIGGNLTVTDATVAVPSREISKLALKRKLDAVGKWAAFKEALAANESLDDEFWLAQAVRTDDPMFTTHAPALKAALGLTDEQFSGLLAP